MPESSRPKIVLAFDFGLRRIGVACGDTLSRSASALQTAAVAADPRIIKALLKAGVNPDSPNPEGQTALMVVARSGNVEAAKAVGRAIAERTKAAGVSKVAFDRAGFQYHGRVKALADAAREAGLEF